MIVGADAANDQTILDTSANLYGSYKLKRVYYSAFSPIPDASRALPLQRAAAGARAPALPGRLADAVLRFRRRRNRRRQPTACCRSTSIRSSPGRCGTATASRSTSTAPAARSCCACPASAPRRSTASSPPAASPRFASPIWRGCISRGTRRCRSSFSAITARRRICWMARAGGTVQAEGGTIGIWILALEVASS